MMRGAVVVLLIAASTANAGHEFDGRDLAAGAVLYSEHCADCHGANLEGQPNWRVADENGVLPAPPHDETGHTWHHSNTQLFDYTKLGGQEALGRSGVTGFTSGMPGFSGALSDGEIWQVLAFIASTWPARQAKVQAGRNPPH
ncbi:c-type cytochrome [Pelagimonas varians]|nr:cytochrome c [Pelagimonas varians]